MSLLLVMFLSFGVVNADTFTGAFNIDWNSGDTWIWSDIAAGVDITFFVASGHLNASVIMNCTDAGGSFIFTATSSGTLYVSATTGSGASVTMDGITFSSPQAFTAGDTYIVKWLFGASPTASPVTATPVPGGGLNLPTLNMGWLWVYLYSGDIFGFFQAYLIQSFYLADIVAGVICMLFLVPLYIRSKSLLLLCIIWILLGSFFIVAFPIVSGLAVLFIALGIAGLLYKLFRGGYG